MNEVDAILQAVVAYKSKNPKTADKEELVENLFDSLCCLLMPLETKERFVNVRPVILQLTGAIEDDNKTPVEQSQEHAAGRGVAGARRRSRTTTRRLLVSGFVAVASARTQDEDLADLDAEQPDEAAWDDEDRRRFCV
nr:beta-catenin-like protein 1 [Ipomoea trifida]